MDELFDKDAEPGVEDIDVPVPDSRRPLPKEPKSPVEIIEYIISTIATAKVGFKLFSFYASRFKLKDNHWLLFRGFIIVAYMIDIGLAIIVISLAITLLIGITYIALRGVGAWGETVHIIHAVGHDI